MSGPSTYEPKTGFTKWLDARLPVVRLGWDSFVDFPTPRNLNYWYTFGGILTVCLMIQIITGIVLAMHYVPHIDHAFASVQRIDRDVNYGWLVRSIHAVGASMFFLAVYMHIFRGLYYGSYKAPRELLWILGVVIYLLMMAAAFLGYVLPWGNMSYWGAQVIISLAGAIPFDILPFIDAKDAKEIGDALTTWVRGDYLLSTATVNKFFALHVVAIPLVLVALVFLHILALHEVGSNNPDGVEIKQNKDENGIPRDGIPFHPYYTVKDLPGVIIFLIIFAVVVFFFPTGGGYLIEKPNFVPADPLKTPDHIAPVWYYGPYYAMLRATTIDWFGMSSKAWGLIAMGGGIVVLFLLPWLDRHPVKSIRYKGWLSKLLLLVFAADFVMLGYLGTQPASGLAKTLAQIGTVYYFAFFFF
ncbi:MAG TPA: cytochrome b, partial [Oceanicaulis sp.]|nr:cytochrome b [Oceanicaulis sp.]